MKNRFSLFLCALIGTGILSGCRTVHADLPDTKAVSRPAKRALQTKKENLKMKQKSPVWPESLGGLVKSDEWIIYKDAQQEELKGHVSYDNGVYAFNAGYLLSDRKNQTVTAQQKVYIKQHEPQSPTYEVYADWARYYYQTGKGQLKSLSKNPLRFVVTDTAQTITATAQQADFNTQTQTATLTGKVIATRVTPEGTQTMNADKVTFKQKEDYIHLEGNALLSDGLRTLQANTVIYNGAKNEAHAFGARPLVTGSAQQGTFAIIADEVSSDAEGTRVILNGQVQGWLVAPELNNNKLNSKF